MNMNLLHVVTQRILNVFVKVIILLTLNRSRTIIKCVVLGVLFTCVLIGLSSAPIFASSEDSPSSEDPSYLAPDLDSVESYYLAQDVVNALDVSGSRAVSYTVSDVYNLLYAAMRGQSSDSEYSLPRISFHLYRISSILAGPGNSVPSAANSISGRLGTISSNISHSKTSIDDILSALVDGNSTNIPVGPGIRQTLFGIDSQGNWETVFDTTQDSRDLLQLIYSSSQQIHGDGQNNSYYLSQINSKLSGSYSWTTTNITPSWYLNKDRQVISSSQSGTSFSAVFSNFYSTYQDIPLLFRVYVPFMASDLYNVGSDFTLSVGYFDPSNNNITPVSSDIDYFLEPTVRGTFIYLFGFRPHNVSYVTFTLTGALQFDSSYSGSVSYCSFDTDQYQQIKQAFNSYSLNHSISSLADYFVSPEKQAAENASQAVIDDTLDGFTGNGSAAAKTSDTGSMKNMSGSIQSGLSTGASAGNATSVFSNQTFWSWFTQQNSDQINNPYPAPVVNMNNRKSSGDDIVDFMSGHDQELSDFLRGSEW